MANLDEHLLDDDIAAWREGLSGGADSEWSVPHMGVAAGLLAVLQMWLGPTSAFAVSWAGRSEKGWPARSITPGRGRRSRPSTVPPASAQTALSLARRPSVSVGG